MQRDNATEPQVGYRPVKLYGKGSFHSADWVGGSGCLGPDSPWVTLPFYAVID